MSSKVTTLPTSRAAPRSEASRPASLDEIRTLVRADLNAVDAMIRARLRSPNWKMHRAPAFAASHEGRLRHATTRLTASFTYIGAALPRLLAETLLE